MEENRKSPKDQGKDKYILFAFLAFFGVIFIVNGIFITTALKTHRGVVTDQAYEKGIHFNQTLSEAKNQPAFQDKVSFENNLLRWTLLNENGEPITKANVKAQIFRPIQEGHDFEVELVDKGNGIYEAVLDLPFKGLWEARLNSKWHNKTYKTTYQMIQK